MGGFATKQRAIWALSGGDGRHHLVHAENVERSPQIVGERGQAEFGAHFSQAAHQERALIHPLLDAAERMFDRLATAVQYFRPRLQAGRHAVERVLVLETRDGAIAGVRAARPERAIAARRRVGVIDLRTRRTSYPRPASRAESATAG